MKNLENILQEIGILQKILLTIPVGTENLVSFCIWWFGMKRKWIKMGQNRYAFSFILIPLLMVFIYITIILPINFISVSWNENIKVFIMMLILIIYTILLFYWFIYLPYKVFVYNDVAHKRDMQKLNKLEDDIRYIQEIPKDIYRINKELQEMIQTTEITNIFTVSSRILSIIENISGYQRKFYKYFNLKYTQQIEKNNPQGNTTFTKHFRIFIS